MILPFLWCHFKRSEDTLLYCDATVRPSCQHSITNKSYISKFSQVKCSILPFYCTVLFTGCFAKKTLKNLLHRECLGITQETLPISLFASKFLSLLEKTALRFLFTVKSYVQSALQKKVWITYFTKNS